MKNFTDKWGNLLESYRHKNIDYLEIGLYKGESLPLWQNYFGKDCKIYGIDLDLSDISIDSSYSFEFYEMDALNESKFNEHFKDKRFDIIIDDANPFLHVSVFELYSKLLKPGGVYIIETYKCNIQFYKDHSYLNKLAGYEVSMIQSQLSNTTGLCIKKVS